MWPDLTLRGAARGVIEAVEPGLSVDGTTANSYALDFRGRDRMARLSAHSGCMWSCRRNWSRAWGLGSSNVRTGRLRRPAAWAGRSRVGWASDTTDDAWAHSLRNPQPAA